MENYRKPVTTMVSIDDFEYCKSNGLMFSVLLHDRIEQLKGGVNDEIQELRKEVKDMKDEATFMKQRLTEALTVLKKNNLSNDYYKQRESTKL